jgi:NADH:ubiquinone oxidoreductase subunit C
MDCPKLFEKIKEEFKGAVVSSQTDGSFPFLQIQPASLKGVLSFCCHDQALRFDYLENLFGIDQGQELTVVYQLLSTTLMHRITIKVSVERHRPKVVSIAGFWRAAAAYELEAAEMFGFEFEGHPKPGNLLLPEGWQGFPLRKDYVYPVEYNGVEHRRDPLRKEHVRP